MTKKSKQHYVPQYYFRQFSENSRNIEKFDLNRKMFFTVKIKNECSKKNFYGNDSEIEMAFSTIENFQSKVFKKLINYEKLTKEDYVFLLYFLLLQHSRTKKEKKMMKIYTQGFVENYMKPLLKHASEKGELDVSKDEIDKLKITFPMAHSLPIGAAFEMVKLISDLKPIMLINNTVNDFIFSDSPVIFHNSYFHNIKDSGTTGLQVPGLQVFCPINNNLLLMLFDNSCYKITIRAEVFNINKKGDINKLNTLQFLYCDESIYFSNRKKQKYIKRLNENIFKSYNRDKLTYNFEKIPHPNKPYTKVLKTYRLAVDY